MPTVAELSAKVTANVGDFQTNIKKANDTFNNFRDDVAKGAQVVGGSGLFKGLSDSLTSVSGTLKSVGGEMAGFGAGMIATFTAPVAFAIKAASDFGESLNKTREVFGAASGTIETWATGAVQNLGLSRQAALDAAGGFGNLFTQLGVGREKAADMSTGIVQLAADFASFHNADISEVLNAQAAAFRGEYDSLQRFLPLMSAATVEQEALAMTHKATNKELTAQDKALAVVSLMYKGAGSAAGDFARTSDGLANVMRIVQAQVQDLAIQVGQEFLPKVQAGLAIVRNWMKAFSDLSPEIKSIIISIVGFGAVLGPVIVALGAAVTALGALISPVGLVIAAVAGLGVAFATNFGGIRDTVSKWASEAKQYYEDHKADIQALGTKAKEIFETYIKDLGDVAASVVRLIDSMKSTIDGFSTSNDGSWKAIAAAAKLGLYLLETALQGCIRMFQGAVVLIEAFWKPIEKIIIEPIKNAISWVKSHANEFAEAGNLIAQSFKDAVLGPWFKSPFFIDHTLEDSAKHLHDIIPPKMSKAGKEIAKALKKAFEDELKDINTFLERTFGGTGSISERILKELKKKFPEVTKELNEKSEAFRRINENLELYTVLMATASGRNTEVAKKITEIIKQLQKKAEVLASEVNPQFAKLNNNLAANLPISEDLGEAIRGTVGGLATLTINAKRAGDAAQQLADKNFKDLLDRNEELSRQLPDGWKKILDAVANSSGKQGAELVKLSNKYKEWAGDVIGIIDLLPGKFGDAARRVVSTAEQWIAFGDKVLSIMSRIFGEAVPSSVAEGIGKIIGIFKSKKSDVELAMDELWGPVVKNAGAASGTSFVDSFLQKIPAIATGLTTFFGTRGQGKLAGVLGGAFAGFQMGGLIGAGIGAIAGLFGTGKSKEQKEAEERAKEQAKLQTQDLINSIQQGILETMSKGAALLEQIGGFIELPRKQIRRFINQLTLVMTEFVDAMKNFKLEAASHAKAISDNLGSGFELMLGGAQLIEAISKTQSISQESINAFVKTVIMIADAWVRATEEIEKGMAKRAEKISSLLITSFEFLRIIPDTVKALVDTGTISDEQIVAPMETAKRIFTKLFELFESFADYAITKFTKTAEKFASIATSGKAIFDFFSGYKPLDQSAFENIQSDFDRVTDWFKAAIAQADEWLSMSDLLGDKLLQVAANLSGISGAIQGAFAGGGGGENLTLQPAYSAGNFATAGGGGFGAAGSQQTVIVNVHGSLIHQSQLQDVIVETLEEINSRGRS